MLTNERTGSVADIRSVLELVSADVRFDDPCRVTVSGEDENAIYKSIVEFIEKVLPGCDEPLMEVSSQSEPKIPRLLVGEDVTFLMGTAASPGIGCGKVVMLGSLVLPGFISSEIAENPNLEQAKLNTALTNVRSDLEGRLSRAASSTEADILHAHLSLVKDAALARELELLINEDRRTAGQAIVEAIDRFANKLLGTGSAYLHERIIDLQDIGAQLLEYVCDGAVKQPDIVLREPSIVVAANLAPSQLLSLERKHLRGLILENAGNTSHAVILARSSEIPVVTGVNNIGALHYGQDVVVDANRGLVVFPISAAVRCFYDKEIERERQRKNRLARYIESPAVTQDGYAIEVAANIATDAEADAAVINGADSVGLFRTEMIFSERDTPPSEEEQFEIYKRVIQSMNGRSVIIRTFDVGGDKPLPYLKLPKEENPFLGYRGIRLYPDHFELFINQLRAIVRASALGPVKVMAPMVSSVEEAQWLRASVIEIQADLKKQGIPYDDKMPVGIMVEVPSAALIIDKLSEVVDFFSIGTNDLCQYWLAVDRGNQHVSKLYSERHPSFIRLLKTIVDQARQNGKWIGMCGEMARSVENLPILIGLGLDEISLSSPNIPAIKAAINKLKLQDCRRILNSAIARDSREQVDAVLSESVIEQPLVCTDLIALDSDSGSKEEAIKELVDLLYVAGRTQNPVEVEEAVWSRELVYSTGLGYGFAIPHCKTDCINANSLGILKLRNPIDWNSIDDKPVDFVILLAVRESDQNNSHMRIFSKLARNLMSDEFRESLLSAKDDKAILSHLAKELDI